MRIVRAAGELSEAARIAASEAKRYFGDGRVYVERYVERPRHIEVQVLGDGNGNAVHLFERECSVQRRFQKIVEESPSPACRRRCATRICDAAAAARRGRDYINAGTVEFILGADGRFYFLEMNTRLQVEHPVTEMVTGLDLVRAQIAIAAGQGLPLAQSEIVQHGHAIECRIYAEDPARDFMPDDRRDPDLGVPRGAGIRFDSAHRRRARRYQPLSIRCSPS